MPSFTIRPATPADVPAILSLIRELAAYEKLSHACVATEDLLTRHLFGEGTEKAAEALVAEAPADSGGGATSIVAYAIYFKTFSTFLARPGLYLEDLYVQPAHRHRGIGTAFFRRLAAIALARNFGRIEWSVLTWNAPALTFYQQLGAQPLTDWSMMRLTEESFPTLAHS
ncbi:MAG TPA: GNAT family N-acetyltransferase [Phycisphaerae bacterium]|nr:GNAT family N-acetyltransferase [Phycisphaerae bacterium]